MYFRVHLYSTTLWPLAQLLKGCFQFSYTMLDDIADVRFSSYIKYKISHKSILQTLQIIEI